VGSNIFDEQEWARTPSGKIILRLIEEWEAGVTEHGDIALSFTSTLGNDPGMTAGEEHRAQFICTREDARAIAQMLLRAIAFSESGQASGFDNFVSRIKSPALRAVARHWNQARGDRQMPSWDEIKLDTLGPQLGRIWAFDYDAGTSAFIGRLAGSNIMLGFGKSFLSTPLRDLHSAAHVFEECQANFLQIVSEPACCLWSGKLFRMGDKIVEGERLILPMGAGGKAIGILGASDYQNYPLSRTPEHVELIHDSVDWCRL
jgi:hypothetical protein